MSMLTLSIDDAINVANVASDIVQDEEHEPGDIDVHQLASAARQLVQEVYALRAELDRERARNLARPDAPRVEGHPLLEGSDDGGRRHFLDSRPIHAGQPLFLLTHLGWYPVRYELNMPKGQALLCFSIPGAYDESVIPAPAGGIRLAWPDELNRRTRNVLDRSQSGTSW